MRQRILVALSALLATAALAGMAGAQSPFPSSIDLPDGWQPEGIAVSSGGTFYVGSIPTGAVYRGDLRTGQGSVLVPATPERAAIGLKVDAHGRLFVAGGPTGMGFVYDARTGADIAQFELTTDPTFVNDVVVTRNGAYFTDSFNQVLYRVPIGPNGSLAMGAETIPLTGDIVFQMGFNVNGIDATPNGKKLVIVQSNTGKVFTVDPATGIADEIQLDQAVTFGDGILLDGKTLYVVRNQQNRIAVIKLSPDLTSGSVVRHITATPPLDIPTTVAEFGHSLYAVNARFTTPPGPTVEYSVTKVQK
jgi:outer membrane protein assembly factor BamB